MMFDEEFQGDCCPYCEETAAEIRSLRKKLEKADTLGYRIVELESERDALKAENEDMSRALVGLEDCKEDGWAGTLKGNILHHLNELVDLEKHWDLNHKADAGHTRQVAFIVFRAFGLIGRQDKKISSLEAENARILEVVAEAQGMLEDYSWAPSNFTRHDVSCKLAEAFVGKGEE